MKRREHKKKKFHGQVGICSDNSFKIKETFRLQKKKKKTDQKTKFYFWPNLK